MKNSKPARCNWFLCAAFLGSFFLIGCKAKPPEIVEIGGTVQLNGKPLGNASVVFVPMAEGLDANFIASGVTDDDGKFSLSLPGAAGAGCCACECKVTVGEGPMPDAAYVQNDKGIAALLAYERKLKNRPIPDRYQGLGTTPLSHTITESKTDLKLELER